MIDDFLIAPTAHELFLAVGAFVIIITTILLSQIIKLYTNIFEEYTRKLVHVFIGLLAAIAPFFFNSPIILILFAIVFASSDWYAVKKGYFKGIHGNRFSYGTVYFPLAYLILLIAFWNIDKYVIFIGISFFALPDAIAALVGQSIKTSHKFVVIRDTKSLEGSAAFFLTGVLLLILSFSYFDIQFSLHSGIDKLLIAISISAITTMVETLSAKGSDNFFVPISVALITFIFQVGSESQIYQIFLGITLAALMILISHYLKFLTKSGLILTFLLAVTVFGLGGIKWTLPILTFFILSSILSKTGKGIKEKFKDTFEKTGTRDYAQVLANGGIAGIIVIIHYFHPNEYLYYLYLISLAVATADTWATEIGVFSKSKPRLITNFKKVEPGVSGAISLFGTLGALLGSVVLILSGIFFLSSYNLILFIFLVFSGFIGSLIDSLLGATLQAQYICNICAKYTEKKIHCKNITSHKTGYKIISNDLVNFSSALLTILIFFLIY